LGGWGFGRLYHGNSDEEEPSGGETFGALSGGGCGPIGGNPFSRDDHVGGASLAGQPTCVARTGHTVQTPWGPIEGKVCWGPDGLARFSPEFEACQQAATQQGVPLRVVYEAAQRAFDPGQWPPNV